MELRMKPSPGLQDFTLSVIDPPPKPVQFTIALLRGHHQLDKKELDTTWEDLKIELWVSGWGRKYHLPAEKQAELIALIRIARDARKPRED